MNNLVEYDGKKFKTVTPAGTLTCNGETYFLLNPHLITADWEFSIFERRFVVVPITHIALDKNYTFLYSYARHLVSNAPYSIEYGWHSKPILVWYLEEIDLENVERQEEEETEPADLFDDAGQSFADIHPTRDVNDYIREEQEWVDEMFGLEGVG